MSHYHVIWFLSEGPYHHEIYPTRTMAIEQATKVPAQLYSDSASDVLENYLVLTNKLGEQLEDQMMVILPKKMYFNTGVVPCDEGCMSTPTMN